jgi:hypothetical protein
MSKIGNLIYEVRPTKFIDNQGSPSFVNFVFQQCLRACTQQLQSARFMRYTNHLLDRLRAKSGKR